MPQVESALQSALRSKEAEIERLAATVRSQASEMDEARRAAAAAAQAHADALAAAQLEAARREQKAAKAAAAREAESHQRDAAARSRAGKLDAKVAHLLAQLLSSQPEWGASWGAPPTQTAEEAAGAGEEGNWGGPDLFAISIDQTSHPVKFV